MVVSNNARYVTFRIVAPEPADPPNAIGTTDLLIPIYTKHTRFLVMHDSNGPGLVLGRFSPQRRAYLPLAKLHLTWDHVDVFRLSIRRRLLGSPTRFRFSVEFWASTLGAPPPFDLAPDQGTWLYRLR